MADDQVQPPTSFPGSAAKDAARSLPLEPGGSIPATTLAGSEDADATQELDDIIPSIGYQRTPVVALGGSAGSIPELQRFFELMPDSSGYAFVVVVHLTPDTQSSLDEILQRATRMPVLQVTETMTRIEANHVYVIAPGKILTAANGFLQLNDLPREHGRRVAVDLFFRSLADSHGPHTIAVVLSGADGDGAVGIKRIKERGGLTISQTPGEAEHPGMPQSAIETGMVDWVLPVADMPKRLVEYRERERRIQVPPEDGPNPACAPKPAIPNDEAALRDVLTFLRTRTTRDFSYYKRATIIRRIARRMQVNELEDLPSYLTYLRTHPGEAGALLQDLLISVTNFFRDKDAFTALEAQIPALFKGKTHGDVVRVWVPACATGEEAYSIAILLCEYARTLEAPPALQIFATDLNEDVILTARNGVYSDSVVADLSLERLRRFFIKEHQGYRVRRELREMLLFAVHDLLKDSPFSRLDMVSCRNLLIYLNRDAQQRAFDIFHFSLRPEGRLFLGASEAIDDNSQAFVPTDKKFRIYMPRSAVRMNLPIPPSAPFSLRAPGGLHEKLEVSLPPSTPEESAGVGIALLRRTRQEHGSWSELHFKLIERFGPPSLLVNNQHEIVHLSENVGRFLQFTGGEPSMSLLRAVHPALRVDLRAALYRATQSGEPTSALRVPMDLGGARLSVDIHVSPAGESATDFLLVVFDARENTEKDTARTGPQEDEPVVWHIERELEQTKRHLRDLVEQHEASTEELKASNEELQAMNEELRSATEELETSREELQSINEELTTVNQELKAKVDELGHTNSDLHNLMGATAIATVFLDRELRIMRFTPPAVALFSLIPTDVGRPLADLKHRLDYADLLPDAARVLQQLVPIEREVSEYGGRVFLARLLPYRTTEDRIAGVVLTFVDVTERHLAQEAVRRAHEELERRVQERTAQLDEANAALRREILEHQRAERARQELQARLIGAQEEERAHFSRELHDEVGQQLTALMLSLKAIESAVQGEAAAQELRSLRSTAELVAREIHQLATELRPIVLDDLGLARALTSYIEAWATRTGISVDFVFSGFEENRLPSGIETTLYRIVQEAMNNVVKHAHAKNVSVCIERYEDRVVGSVEDDGRGFDVDSLSESVTESHRIGIAGMRERAAIVAGTLSLESAVGRGTVVRVNIPLPQSSKMP